MFLPAINLLVAGCVAAFALNGFTGVGDFLIDWISLPSLIVDWLFEKRVESLAELPFPIVELRAWCS
jgi:hypothetical protein